MSSTLKVLAGAVAVGLFASASMVRADVWYIETDLSHDQHIPPTGSPATGHASLVYDDETNLLSCDIYIEGIMHENLLYGHLHQGRWGFYGEMITMLGHGHMWERHGDGLRYAESGIVIDPMWKQEIITEGAYVNIHTVQWPAGEIRGQAWAVPRLSHTDLQRGQVATFSVSRVQSGETVYFLYSMNGVGEGRSIPGLGGLRLDLLDSVGLIGSARADANGSARLSLMIPRQAPPVPIALQAVIRRGPAGRDSVKSNTRSTFILP